MRVEWRKRARGKGGWVGIREELIGGFWFRSELEGLNWGDG